MRLAGSGLREWLGTERTRTSAAARVACSSASSCRCTCSGERGASRLGSAAAREVDSSASERRTAGARAVAPVAPVAAGA
eukprot:1764635-Prymnesium_polylepis.1